MESTIAGRRRNATRHSAEDQALDQIAKEAEARLAARRQARAEAREIRMRELERQQKEAEENADRVYDMCSAEGNRTMRVTPDPVRTSRLLANSNNFQSSRRSSEDSLEDAGLSRDLRLELKEFEEKFRKAMIANAQLDNEKSSYGYQVDLLKDKLEELDETTAQLRRELREKNREAEQLKRISQRLKEDFDVCRAQLLERDTLIQENGLVIVDDEGSGDDDAETANGSCYRKRVLVSTEAAELLQNAGEGSLDVRLRKFASEKKELQDEIGHLRLELEEAKSRLRSEKTPGSVLGLTRSVKSRSRFVLSRSLHEYSLSYRQVACRIPRTYSGRRTNYWRIINSNCKKLSKTCQRCKRRSRDSRAKLFVTSPRPKHRRRRRTSSKSRKGNCKEKYANRKAALKNWKRQIRTYRDDWTNLKMLNLRCLKNSDVSKCLDVQDKISVIAYAGRDNGFNSYWVTE